MLLLLFLVVVPILPTHSEKLNKDHLIIGYLSVEQNPMPDIEVVLKMYSNSIQSLIHTWSSTTNHEGLFEFTIHEFNALPHGRWIVVIPQLNQKEIELEVDGKITQVDIHISGFEYQKITLQSILSLFTHLWYAFNSWQGIYCAIGLSAAILCFIPQKPSRKEQKRDVWSINLGGKKIILGGGLNEGIQQQMAAMQKNNKITESTLYVNSTTS